VRRRSLESLGYWCVVALFTVLTVRLWWLSDLLPAMDYPQYLVFVRAIRDCADPASPFHGTYEIAPWFLPTVLPIRLTSFVATLCGGSLEAAGKVMLSAHAVGMVGGAVFLLRELGRPRWAVVLLFPLIHSRWLITGGYYAFATSLPLVLLTLALLVRWLRAPALGTGALLAGSLCGVLLWHGIGFVIAGLGVAVLWFLWRAPSLRARALSAVPMVPCLVLCAVWQATTFVGGSSKHIPPSWRPVREAAETFVEFVWASIPHNDVFAVGLLGLVLVGLALARMRFLPTEPGARAMWRVRNPFLLVSLAYLAGYFFLPMHVGGVEGMSSRFAYPAALAFVFAWSLPAGRTTRALVVGSVLVFAAYCLHDMAGRFRAFHEDTRGASALIDRIGLHETLYSSSTDRGVSKFFASNHPAIREIEQYATSRKGGLPNSSFAGYGINYVRYVNGKNPMPGLSGPPRWSEEMRRFDYVLSRAGEGPADRRFRLVGTEGGWELYGVCGSARFPDCP
jgi:hypothetical protein